MKGRQLELKNKNMPFSEEVFVESKTARDNQISAISNQQTEDILNKVKQIFFAVWEDISWLTLKQVAEFYEVSEETIDTNFKRHRDEFELDGVKLLQGKALEDVRFIMNLASKTSSVNLFTVRAVLRMGFILRGSEVAKQVRTVALNIIQTIPALLPDGISSQRLKPIFPAQKNAYGSRDNPITEITTDIKNGHGWGGNENILEQWIVLLATYADMSPWRQISMRSYYKTSKVKNRRFDLLLRPKVPIFKKHENIVIVSELKSNYIDDADIVNAVYAKEYPKLAYKRFLRGFPKFDYLTFQLVAPAGVTEAGVKKLDELQSYLSSKYEEKIYLNAIRLDEFILSQIFPAITQTYIDEQGKIGHQFAYVKEEIEQLCFEIFNPDLWVNEFKALRRRNYEVIKQKNIQFLPRYPLLHSESSNSEEHFIQPAIKLSDCQ